MSRVAVNGASYEVRTGGSGPALLLLHGFTGRSADWAPLLPALRRLATTVSVDLLGHGASDAPADPSRHALESQAADLAALLRRLHATPAHVLGYSFGARVGLRLAADHPASVRRLILESPSPGIADPVARAARAADDEALAAGIERDGIEAFVDSWWETTPVFESEKALPAAARARLRAARLRNTAVGLAGSLRGAGQGAMTPLHDRLAGITVPTLVIAGDRDPIGARRAGEVAAAMPRARVVVIPGAGHAAHRETPAAFRRLITSFLQQEEPAA